jgi:single-strand DNA-binding protein
MNHLNTILIEGNLTRDPQYRSANDGCSFTIANNRYYLRDGKWVNEASFFIVYAFGKLGDSCLKYLTKGRGVRVCGRLRQVTSKRQNLPQDFVFIIAEHVEFQPTRSQEKTDILEAAQGSSGNALGNSGVASTNTEATREDSEETTQKKIFDPNADNADNSNASDTEALSSTELEGPEAFDSDNKDFEPSISMDADSDDAVETGGEMAPPPEDNLTEEDVF